MTIELNGTTVDVEPGASVEVAVERAGAGGATRGVAVAVDGAVVPRSAWSETELREGQKVEVVRAVQGG